MYDNEKVPELHQTLSDKEIALRDSFIKEYMVDFEPFSACLRMGFLPTFAADWSKRLYQDPYVQRGIAKATREQQIDPKTQEAQDRALIENTLREGMQRGPFASRTAAARLMAEMRGWAKPDTADAEKALIDLFKDMASKVPV